MLIAALVSATVPAIPFPVGNRISRVPTPCAILLQSSPFALSRRKREHRSASTTRAAACTISFSKRSRSRSATRAFATSSTLASFATLACKRSIGSESIADEAAASVAVRHADARRFSYVRSCNGCRGRRPPPVRVEPAADLRLRREDAADPRRQRRVPRRARVRQGRGTPDGRAAAPPCRGLRAAPAHLRAGPLRYVQGRAEDGASGHAPQAEGRVHV